MNYDLLKKYEKLKASFKSGEISERKSQKEYSIIFREICDLMKWSKTFAISSFILFAVLVLSYERGFVFIIEALYPFLIGFIFLFHIPLLFSYKIPFWACNLEYEKITIKEKQNHWTDNVTEKIIDSNKTDISKFKKNGKHLVLSIIFFEILLIPSFWHLPEMYKRDVFLEKDVIFLCSELLILTVLYLLNLMGTSKIFNHMRGYNTVAITEDFEKYEKELLNTEKKILSSKKLSAEYYLVTKDEELKRKIEKKHLQLTPEDIAKQILQKDDVKTLVNN